MFNRILYVENGLGLGGATRGLHSLVRAVRQRGCEPFVAMPYHDPELKLLLGDDHLLDIAPFRRFGGSSQPASHQVSLTGKLGGKLVGSARHLLNTVAKDAPLTRFLQKEMKARHIELVHTNNGLLANRAAIEAAGRAGLPLIAHQRGWEWPCALSRNLAGKPARIIAVSEAVRQDLLEIGAPSHSVRRIYDGVDLKQFRNNRERRATARKRFGLEDQTVVIGLIATHLAWKGHDLYLQALAQVCHKTDSVRGLVVGSRPTHAEPLSPSPKESAHQLGIADRIIWSGHLPDPAPAYAACDVAVHASKQPEPFGLVVVEAMACGLPVVAAEAGGPSEIVLHGETGLLYPMGKASALAGALETLISRPQWRGRLGDAARRRAAEHFDEQKGWALLFDVYQETEAALLRSALC